MQRQKKKKRKEIAILNYIEYEEVSILKYNGISLKKMSRI